MENYRKSFIRSNGVIHNNRVVTIVSKISEKFHS